MNTFIITYQLGGPEDSSSYKSLIAEIQKFGNRAKPMRSVWLVKCNNTHVGVRDHLMKYLDPNDRLLVIDVTNSIAAGQWAAYILPKDVVTWLQSP